MDQKAIDQLDCVIFRRAVVFAGFTENRKGGFVVGNSVLCLVCLAPSLMTLFY